MKTTIKAVAYARYSSDKQQESSITVQLGAIHAFCDAHNIELIHEYVDEAQTGTNVNRKSFQEMIQEAPNKNFQLVIVHRMDRWARNVDDARYYKKYLSKFGIKIVSSIEEFDETPEGEFFELMSLGMAELYSKKLSREASAGKLANAKEGKAHGGVPLLGYTVKNKRYVIEPLEVEAVKTIFDLYLKGYSYTYIRDYLNSNGFTHADGRPFTKHFYDILRNRKYMGEYVYNRSIHKDAFGQRNNHKNKDEKEIIRIQGAIPQIIDVDTFQKVQALMDRRQEQRNCGKNPNVPTKNYILTGLLRCKKCGGGMFGCGRNGHGIKRKVYDCHKSDCPVKTISSDYFEDYVQNILCKTLLNPKYYEQLCMLCKQSYIKKLDQIAEHKHELNKQIKEHEKNIVELSKELSIDNSKVYRNYIEESIECEEQLISKCNDELFCLNNDMKSFPRFSMETIKKNAAELVKTLSCTDKQKIKECLRKVIIIILVDNDTVEIDINSGYLMGTYQNIRFTIIQKRDTIALLNQHHLWSWKFEDLTVKI